MPRAALVSSLALALLAHGCGAPAAKTYPVRGKLVAKDGAAFKPARPGNQPLPPGDPGIRVKFARTGEVPAGEDAFYYATVNGEDSTFNVPGKANAGIPAGQYKVTVLVGAAGEGAGGKGPPRGGPPGAGAPSMDGKEVAI
ncbi:MAG: hypothetical protein FJ304_19195, partial [Planctomycetes bacterium]|nr:hypothetical protein [Planctomycetota bacterium]